MTALLIAEDVVKDQVPSNRQSEIEWYLRLFGYEPEQTTLEVHLAGSFGKRPNSLTVVGRTHDPVLGFRLLHPDVKPERANPGYLGCLFAPKDEEGRSPHELLPLDFTPLELTYPLDWKVMFDTEAFLVAMHVPPNFAPSKSMLHTTLRRIGGAIDVKNKWDFLDELEDWVRRS